ncbi:MAG TPA: EAL domain-containing protein, partial [Pirellulales bacterium]|nr:EAL domain-containing protein [Pirellulales bacterium]
TLVLVQVLPGAPMMHYNTALLLFWLGMAIVLLSREPLWLPGFLGAIIAIIAVVPLGCDLVALWFGAGNSKYLDWRIADPHSFGRIAATTAICFLLSGLSVVSLSIRRGFRLQPLFECLGGSIVFASGAVAAFGYFLGFEASYGWGGSSGMAVHTALAFSLVGTTIVGLALVHARNWSPRIPQWLPLPVAFGAATAALALCQALYVDDDQRLNQISQARADKLTAHISQRLTSRVQSMERMAHRWSVAGQPALEHWEAEAALSLKYFADFQSIAWINPDGEVAWLVARRQNPDRTDNLSGREGENAQALRLARETRHTVITGACTRVDDQLVAQIVSPIFRDAEFEGCCVATFDIPQLVSDLAREELVAGYQVAIADESQTLFRSQAAGGAKLRWRESTLDRGGIHWRVRLRLTPEAAAARRSRLPVSVLGCGLLFAAVLGLAIHFAQAAYERSKAAERVSKELRESQERFELAVRGSSDGIWDWNLETDQTYYSPRFKQLLAYEASAAIDWKQLIHPDDRENTLAALQSHLDYAVPFDVTCRLMTSEQSPRWVRLRGEATKSEHGIARRMAGSLSDMTALKEFEEQLISAALLDKLTSLPNRALLLDRLQHMMARAARGAEYHYAVMFIDFDRFKIINDSLGHDVGDSLLREIADRLRNNIRSVDSVSRCALGHTTARLGGDEFVVLLDDLAAPEDIHIVAERLLTVLSKPYQLGAHEVHSTASVGVVCGSPNYTGADELLRDADTAMYEAKRLGKARYVVFDDSMRRGIQRRLQLENDLRKAIGTDQLWLAFQPIVSLDNGEICCVEALLRWSHPTEGLISPAEFIPVAEECDLIHLLGEWVLRAGCQQMTRWIDNLGAKAPGSVSINLSRKQFAKSTLYTDIRQALTTTGLPPERLQLEITEVAFNSNAVSAIEAMRAIRELGVHLAVDDFGTGNSTFAAVHQFPIDMLKVDRSFLDGVEESTDTVAMIQVLTILAEKLKIVMVAEGVETQAQATMLHELNCRYAQGYFFAKPMPAAEFEEFARSRVASVCGSFDHTTPSAVVVPQIDGGSFDAIIATT